MKVERYTILLGIFLSCLFAYLSFAYYEYKKNPDPSRPSQKILDAIDLLSLRYNDFKYKARQAQHPEVPVVLVAIDDESIKEVGRWPWSREWMAKITENLIQWGAVNVTFDIIFSEPERGFPENDLKMQNQISQHSEKIILGVSSDRLLSVRPYQDYCMTEAFLQNGGDQIVKINPTFIVDDVSGDYDTLQWSDLFKPFFQHLTKQTEKDVLQDLGKNSVEQLTQFQKNYLQSLQSQSLFTYCDQWLTSEDLFLQKINAPQIMPMYKDLFAPLKNNLPVSENIKNFKSFIPPHPIPQYGEWSANIPVLQEPALYTASFIAHQDIDGYVRRYPLFFRTGNRLGSSYIPSLALQSYLVAKGYRADIKIEQVPGLKSKAITSFQIVNPQVEPEQTVASLPVDSKGQILVNYYGRQMSLPYVSARDLLNDKDEISVIRNRLDINSTQSNLYLKSKQEKKSDFFKGRSVIIGATALGLYDLRTTPLEANFPGPEIHLTVLANLLEQSFIKTLQNEALVMPILILFIGILSSFVWSYFGALVSFSSFAVMIAVFIATEFYLFIQKSILLSGFLPLALLAIIFLLITTIKYFSEEVKKKQIRSTFSKYVSPAVVDELLSNTENLKLGGRKQVMSVFFSDVRGFTTISEKLPPDELSALLNRYLTPMTEIVFNNKGTLDKYMGDAIMAFFGAPVASANHAHQACQCALDTLVKLKELQLEFKTQNLPEIDIGIGINTGEMSVGNMGSNIVQSYTVMGDSVNLASRLEGINKQYGTRIVISEFTQEHVQNDFITREIDWVKVKGKNKPVRIFELIQKAPASDSIQQWLSLYTKAYQLYHNKQFAEAKTLFLQIIDFKNEDSVAQLYVERCDDFIQQPPGADWDGVYESKTK